MCIVLFRVFFFNDPATTEIYPLSLHDALPIWALLEPEGVDSGWLPRRLSALCATGDEREPLAERIADVLTVDRKSTRLNSSHANISYAVFCLKKKQSPLTDQAQSHTITAHWY